MFRNDRTASIISHCSAGSRVPTPVKDAAVIRVTSEVRSISDKEKINGSSSKPNYRANVPILGLVSLGCVVLAAGLAALTLVLSNGKRKEQWPEQIAPNVIISGLNSFASIMLAIAVGQGVSISWWRRATQGSTIKELHRAYGFSASIKEIVFNLKYFNVIALAALATKLAIVDSLLLQRSFSSETSAWYNTNYDKVIGVTAKTLPITGTLAGNDTDYMTSHFREVAMEWLVGTGMLQDEGYSTTFRACDGVCASTMEMAGFAMDCTDFSETSVEYSLTNSSSDSNRAFYSNWDMTLPGSEQDYPSIDLEYGYVSTSSSSGDSDTCKAVFKERSCKFRPALLNCQFYVADIQASEGAASALLTNGVTLWPNYVYLSNYTMSDVTYGQSQRQNSLCSVVRNLETSSTLDVENGNSTIGGFALALSNQLSSHAYLQYNNASNTWSLPQTGILPTMETITNPTSTSECTHAFYDPMDYVAMRINQLTFASAMRAFDRFQDSSNIEIYDSFKAGDKVLFHDTEEIGVVEKLSDSTRTYDTVLYVTNFYYLAGAMVSVVLCIACVLPSYWGYWDVEVNPGLGPFEIATAFRTPALEREVGAGARRGSNAAADSEGTDECSQDIQTAIKSVGNRQVVADSLLKGRLVVKEVERV